MGSLNVDGLLEDAAKIVIQYDRVSASLLQRRLSIGYARAARLMDELESLSVIEASDGTSRPRKVLITSFEDLSSLKGSKKNKEGGNHSYTKVIYKPRMAKFLPIEIQKPSSASEMPVGYNSQNKLVKVNFGDIGHLLIVGSPISKKREVVDTFLISILSHFDTKKVNIIIYDSSRYFERYSRAPHNLCPVMNDYEKALSALRWALVETDRRLKKLNEDTKATFPEVYVIYVYDFGDTERNDALKRLTSIASMANIHVILLADQLADISKDIRDNVPVRLTMDKFGEYISDFEFRTTKELTHKPIKRFDVKAYLNKL